MVLEYFSNVSENGKLQVNVSKKIASELKQFANKRVEIKIQKLKSTRSAQQNRYLHLLFTIFKDELNALGNEYTMLEVKELCKFKFSLIDVINKETGEVIGQRIKGTSEMGKIEMCEFIDKIIIWAADFFNIKLPYPGEILELDLE